MLIMLAESARFNRMGITPRQVDRLFMSIYLLIIHLEISNPEHLVGIKLRATTNFMNSNQQTIALTLYA